MVQKTVPMMDYLKKLGWSAEVVFFTIEILKDSAKTNEIFEYVKGAADAYVSHLIPGNLKEEALL